MTAEKDKPLVATINVNDAKYVQLSIGLPDISIAIAFAIHFTKRVLEDIDKGMSLILRSPTGEEAELIPYGVITNDDTAVSKKH